MSDSVLKTRLEYLSPSQAQRIRWRETGFESTWLQNLLSRTPEQLGIELPSDPNSRRLPGLQATAYPGESRPEGFTLVLNRLQEQEQEQEQGIGHSALAAGCRHVVEVVLENLHSDHLVALLEKCANVSLMVPVLAVVPVLVIEKVSLRYLELLALIARNTPLMVIQMDCIRVGGSFLLNFACVLNWDRNADMSAAEAQPVAAPALARQHDLILAELQPPSAGSPGPERSTTPSNSLWDDVSTWLSDDDSSSPVPES